MTSEESLASWVANREAGVAWLWAFLNTWTNLGSRLDGGVTRDVRTLWDLCCFLPLDFLGSLWALRFSALRASDSPLAGTPRLEILSRSSRSRTRQVSGLGPELQLLFVTWLACCSMESHDLNCLCPILPSPTTLRALCHRHEHGQHWLAVCHHWHLCTLC